MVSTRRSKRMEYFAWAYVALLTRTRGTRFDNLRELIVVSVCVANRQSLLRPCGQFLDLQLALPALRPDPPSTLAGFQPILADAFHAPYVRAADPEGPCSGFRSGLPGRSAFVRAEARSNPIRSSTDPRFSTLMCCEQRFSHLPGTPPTWFRLPVRTPVSGPGQRSPVISPPFPASRVRRRSAQRSTFPKSTAYCEQHARITVRQTPSSRFPLAANSK